MFVDATVGSSRKLSFIPGAFSYDLHAVYGETECSFYRARCVLFDTRAIERQPLFPR